LRIYISKIGVQLHVPESMSGVQKVNFTDWWIYEYTHTQLSCLATALTKLP
jgi:hypothetical protein